MKFIRFGLPGQERPGLIDPLGGLRDLSAHVRDIDGALLADAAVLAALRALDPFSLPPVSPADGAARRVSGSWQATSFAAFS